MNAGRVVALLGAILVRLRAVLAIVAMVVAFIGLGVPAASAFRAPLVVNGHEAAEAATGGHLALTRVEGGLATSARPEVTLNSHGYDSTLVASSACTAASAEIGPDLDVHGAAAALSGPGWSYDSSASARIPSRLGGCRLTPSAAQRHVIGGMEDLGPGALRPGEVTVASQLPGNAGNRLGNWLNNRDVLRSVMREGRPIRDASVDSAGNLLYQDTRRFITLERDFLRSHGWRYDPSTQLWMPPG